MNHFPLDVDHFPHANPVATTTPVRVLCLTCGTIKKSDKLSCCARGGSWYGKCGGTGNTKHEHTWAEGIQACSAQQPNVAVELQQTGFEENSKNSSDDSGASMNSETIVAPFQIVSSTSTNAPMSVATAISDPENTPITSARMFVRSIAAPANNPTDVAVPHASGGSTLKVRRAENIPSIATCIGLTLIVLFS